MIILKKYFSTILRDPRDLFQKHTLSHHTMPYLFNAAYESWIDYMDNGGRQHSNGSFVSDAVALFAKQWGFDVIPAIIHDYKNEFSEFFYSIKNHYGCDMDVLLDRMESDTDEKFACNCFIRFPVKYQQWFINWLNQGIEYFIFATCDSYMEHPFSFYHSNNKTIDYYDEEVIESPETENYTQQHYESDYEDSLPDLEEVVTDDDNEHDDDDYDPYKNYYYDDPKKTNDDINDITPQQALDVIEKMDTPITFGSMTYEEAQELQQNAEDTWNQQYHTANHFNKNNDWDYNGGW